MRRQMKRRSAPRMPELRRASLTRSSRWCVASGVGASAALLLLVMHVVAPIGWLELVAIWILGGALLCLWAGIVTWRMPVLGSRALGLSVAAWCVGIGASIWLAGWGLASRSLLWRRSVQWLALALSLVVGALLLRALLRKRAAPVVGRLLSLVSPLIVALVIVATELARAA